MESIHPGSRRPRRLRSSAAIRALVQETRLTESDLLYPIFVTECSTEAEPIPSLPGQFRQPLTQLPNLAKTIWNSGIRAVMVFPVNKPERKDARGSYAFEPDGLICRAIETMKQAAPELLVLADVALDPFTDHGHDGLINDKGEVLNDPTVEALCRMSLVLAKAGCDMICPSDMMDGRIGAIRETLDRDGFNGLPILSYCAKYASAFYGPFRDAVGQTKRGLDKKSYQLDPASRRQALIEASLDSLEGADILMVKPGLPYLDILRDLREHVELPLAAYQVSGEYAMIKAAAEKGWIDEQAIVLESLLAFKRAGADMIASYFALDAARMLQDR